LLFKPGEKEAFVQAHEHFVEHSLRILKNRFSAKLDEQAQQISILKDALGESSAAIASLGMGAGQCQVDLPSDCSLGDVKATNGTSKARGRSLRAAKVRNRLWVAFREKRQGWSDWASDLQEEPASLATGDSPLGDDCAFPFAGCHARLVGLCNRTDLNGMPVIVLDFHPHSQRYEVSANGSSPPILTKSKHLVPNFPYSADIFRVCGEEFPFERFPPCSC